MPSAAPPGPDRVELVEADLGPGARGYFTTRGPQDPERAPQDPYGAFNLAVHVGDQEARVLANRKILVDALSARGASRPHVAWMNQVHSTTVATAHVQSAPGDAPTADALVVDRDDPQAPQAAAVLVADCVPLLLASGDGRLGAAVHAGRRGMLQGVVAAALAELTRRGARPHELWAAVGPSICGSCYEVPQQMLDDSAVSEPACRAATPSGAPALDVAAGVVAQLKRAGVDRIATTGICTLEDDRFYSYRRRERTGRQAGIVVL